jgi:hypothetical protein
MFLFPSGLISMQDSRLGFMLVVFGEYPLFSLLYSLSIHPITPVLCVCAWTWIHCNNFAGSSVNRIYPKMVSSARRPMRGPFYGLFNGRPRLCFICPFTFIFLGFSLAHQSTVGPLVGRPTFTHPRVHWLAHLLVSHALILSYPGFVGWHIVNHALILSRVRWLTHRQPHPPTIQGSLVDTSSTTPSYYPGFVGWHIINHAFILSRVRWLTHRQPCPHTIQGRLVDTSSTTPSHYSGLVGWHIVNRALIHVDG